MLKREQELLFDPCMESFAYCMCFYGDSLVLFVQSFRLGGMLVGEFPQ